MEPPDKILKAYIADVNREEGVNASLEEMRLAFKMLYLYHGIMYIQDVFLSGKSWNPRLHHEDRDWLIYWLKHQEFPPKPEVKKKKGKKNS